MGNPRGIGGESKGNLRLLLSRCFQFITSFSTLYLLFPDMSLRRGVTRPHVQDTDRPSLQEFSAVNSHFAPPVEGAFSPSGGIASPGGVKGRAHDVFLAGRGGFELISLFAEIVSILILYRVSQTPVDRRTITVTSP